MSIIARGAAIGFAIAAGIGTCMLGLAIIVVVTILVVTVIAVFGNAEQEDVDDR